MGRRNVPDRNEVWLVDLGMVEKVLGRLTEPQMQSIEDGLLQWLKIVLRE